MTENVIIEVLKYIEDKLYENLKTEDISNEFHFDRSYFSKSFKKYIGISLVDYINERKIIKSMKSVIYSDEKLLKVALSNGFNSLEYFSETFYRVTNFSPSSLRLNEDVKKILPFNENIFNINNVRENHDKILSIRCLNKPKTKVLGVYK